MDDDSVEITTFPKGGGSENMSKLLMLKHNEGIEGVKDFGSLSVTMDSHEGSIYKDFTRFGYMR